MISKYKFAEPFLMSFLRKIFQLLKEDIYSVLRIKLLAN